MFVFEDKIKEINKAIEIRRHKWQLHAVAWMDYEDVAQILRLHVFNKWHLWQQDRPFEIWLSVVIRRRTINLLRDLYLNVAKPCSSCDENDGENKCRKYGVQCKACPLYEKWEKNKQPAYNIKLPVSIENHAQEIYDIPYQDFDVDANVNLIHAKMKNHLTHIQYKVYKALYIDGKTHEEAAKIMGYLTSEKTRSPGYKQIGNMERIFMEKAKKIIASQIL